MTCPLPLKPLAQKAGLGSAAKGEPECNKDGDKELQKKSRNAV